MKTIAKLATFAAVAVMTPPQAVHAQNPTTTDAVLQRIWELGFNQDVSVGGKDYHIQTEVIEIEPLTVASTVLNQGRAIATEEQRLKATTSDDVEQLRSEVAAAHAKVVRRMHEGGLR